MGSIEVLVGSFIMKDVRSRFTIFSNGYDGLSSETMNSRQRIRSCRGCSTSAHLWNCADFSRRSQDVPEDDYCPPPTDAPFFEERSIKDIGKLLAVSSSKQQLLHAVLDEMPHCRGTEDV